MGYKQLVFEWMILGKANCTTAAGNNPLAYSVDGDGCKEEGTDYKVWMQPEGRAWPE